MSYLNKDRVAKQACVSSNQLSFVNFETPFSQELESSNRRVQSGNRILWNR
ncbi:MAG: hypothetical protein ACI97P_000858 [Arcticibacterium sp.]|jgi:hypothetical protein